MIFFASRARRDGDPWLEWRVRAFAVGAVMALAGMFLDIPWMTGSAIGVLLMGAALRFLPHGSEPDDDRPGDDGGPA